MSERNRELANLFVVGMLTALGFASVYIARQSEVSTGSLSYAAFFFALYLVAHVAARFTVPQADPYLLPMAALLTAGLRLTVKRLCHGSGAAHFAEKQDFYLKVAALVCYSQHVSNADFARRLGGLPVELNSAEFTGSGCQYSGFEESGGPKPFVHSYVSH